MLWTEELFHVKKPIIAMLHLEPLPGDPLFSRGTNMQQIADLAKRDLEALQRGGVDGVLISNEFSLPYQRKVDTVTTAAMAFVLGQLCSEISVPYGVDCISDGDATIDAIGSRGLALDYVFSEPNVIDITPKGINKWSALLELCRLEDISPENVVAVGNYLNDRDMIENAGIGVAVGNAEPEIKALADMILQRDHNHDAMEELVDKLLAM